MMMLNRIKAEQNEEGDDGQTNADNDGVPSYPNKKGKVKDVLETGNRDVPSSTADPFETKSTTSSFKRWYAQLSTLLNSQYRVKKVGATKHVLDTYHDSFLYGKVPLTVKVRAALRGGWIGHFWHFTEFILALTSGVLYVYSTYHEYTKFNWVSRAQNYISVVFLVDYVLRVYSEPVRLYYVFSFWGSALPITFLFRAAVSGGRILRLLQTTVSTYHQDNIFDEQTGGCGKYSFTANPLTCNVDIWSCGPYCGHTSVCGIPRSSSK